MTREAPRATLWLPAARAGGARPRRRIFVLGAVAAVAALVLAACGSSPSQSGSSGTGQPDYNKPINIGSTLAPTTLNPQTGTSGADYVYLWAMFDRLIINNPVSGALEPQLATSWTFKNPLELDLTLRQGVKFQDGTAFNAAAVVWSLQNYIRSGDIVNDLQYVTSIVATGPYTVALHLSQPNSQLPWGLTDRAGMIVSPTAYKKEGSSGFGLHPVGTGPYEFQSQLAGQSYTFTSFSGYWNNAAMPRAKTIHWQIYATDTAVVTALRSGTVDIAGTFPQDVKLLSSDTSLKVSIVPGTGFDMVYFNAKLKPFNDPRVRLAFNLALNRQAIMNAATDGLGEVWTEPVPPGTIGYAKSLAPLWTQNIAKAKQLMSAAGYPNGLNLTCYNYPGLGYDITDPIIIAQEAKIGINMKVISGTPAQVVPFYTQNLSPCYVSGWGGGINPDGIYQGILWSQSYYNAGKTDFGVDQYIDKFYTTPVQNSQQLYYNINKAMQTAPGYAPLYSSPIVTFLAKGIAGWVKAPYAVNRSLYWTS